MTSEGIDIGCRDHDVGVSACIECILTLLYIIYCIVAMKDLMLINAITFHLKLLTICVAICFSLICLTWIEDLANKVVV